MTTGPGPHPASLVLGAVEAQATRTRLAARTKARRRLWSMDGFQSVRMVGRTSPSDEAPARRIRFLEVAHPAAGPQPLLFGEPLAGEVQGGHHQDPDEIGPHEAKVGPADHGRVLQDVGD